jgi:hypothetical protein
MDVRTITLAANTPYRAEIPFRFFMLIRTGAALQVTFLASGSRSPIGEIGRDVEAGYKRFPINPSDEGERWGGFILTSTTAQDVTVGVSDSAGDYNRLVQVFELDPGDTLNTAADVATIGDAANVSVIAANASRRVVHITALASNTVNLRIGDTNITGARGLQLQPGMTLSINTRAQIFARAEAGGTNQGVSIAEEVA